MFALNRKSSWWARPAHTYIGGIYWRNKQYSRAADELTRYVTLEPKARDAAKIRETIKDLRSKK